MDRREFLTLAAAAAALPALPALAGGNERIVVQAFFGKSDSVPDSPPFVYDTPRDFLGLPMWRPAIAGRIDPYTGDYYGVYLWAIDHIAAGDVRWVVFGPFADARQAIGEMGAKLGDSCKGVRWMSEGVALRELATTPTSSGLVLPHFAYSDG